MTTQALPQLAGDLFLTDGGIETTLVFHEGIDLPHFAAFHLLRAADGRATLRRCYAPYAEIGRRFEKGLILDTPTWRSNPDWGERLGYSARDLATANRDAVALIGEIRDEYQTEKTPVVVSGCLGPRGDGYVADTAMSVAAAGDYHSDQIAAFVDTAVNMVCAMTMTYPEEAAGIAVAAQAAGLPAVVSFTTETDGKLPNGQSLQSAVEYVDDVSDGYPAYYMINCAHPTHFQSALAADEPWVHRFRGLRCNASRLSHAELDEATELDIGDPVELGQQNADLRRLLPRVNILGGCCGTDARHIEQIAIACGT